MKTILNFFAFICLTELIYFSYTNYATLVKIAIPIARVSFSIELGYIIGLVASLTFFITFCILYSSNLSLKEKIKKYERELEKASVNNVTNDDKTKVLENKIEVLEKALNDALNKPKENQ